MIESTIPSATVAWHGPAVVRAQRSFRVLIIDDNAQIGQISRLLLEADGHAVAVATDGEAGVELAQEFQPEVVLCDVTLPGGMNGFDVARAFRQRAEIRDAVLIAVTGHDSAECRREAASVGFDRFLLKPVEFQELTAIIEQAVTRGR